MDELTAWLTLARAPGLHAGGLRQLLEHQGTVAAVVTASPAALAAAGAGTTLIEWLQRQREDGRRSEIAADLRWLEDSTHHLVRLDSEHYPTLLLQLPDAPVALYVRGDPSLLQLPQLAIVGSRNPTAAGLENAANFAAHLARCGLTITSGLAIGIDTAAHRGALEADGATIAVCGTGLDIDYPRSNAQLAAAIAARGALVSEFALGTPALKGNFPRRNRILSGLALGTLVVEAAVRSGSLITARLAAEQGREVFAIPGSIHNPLARGCHQLIRQGAKLVETADDIFSELRALTAQLADVAQQVPAASNRADGPGNFGPALDKDYEILLDALGFEPAGVDVLVARTGLKAEEVASMLLILELDGKLESHPGGLYVRRVSKAAK
jgi:DNA processing protein